jgi:hypothetical protein
MRRETKPKPACSNLALEPTPAEAAAWDAMTREEQLEALRAELDGPDARADSGMTFEQVLEEARARSAAKQVYSPGCPSERGFN